MILTCLKCLQLHLFLAALQQFQEFPKDSRCLSEIFATVSSFHQLSIGRISPSRWGLTAPIWPMSSMSLASTQLYPTGWSLVTWQNGRMSSQVLLTGTTSEATRALEWWSTIHFIAMMSPLCLSICSHLAVLVCCILRWTDSVCPRELAVPGKCQNFTKSNVETAMPSHLVLLALWVLWSRTRPQGTNL
jgi:hypothetical protein